MIIDSLLEFSVAQAFTASAASTNTIDLGEDRDIGVGTPLYVVVTVDVAADDTDANETYSVALETDDNSSFSSAETLATITIPRGAVAGTEYVIGMPMANQRYLRLNSTLGGTTPSVTLSARLTSQHPPKNQAYPDAL